MESLEESSISLFQWFEKIVLNNNADKYHFLARSTEKVNLNVDNTNIE